MNRKLAKIALPLLCLVALACGCNPQKATYAETQIIVRSMWQKSAPLQFTPEYGDSSATYTVSLAVRHDAQYPYRDLALHLTMTSEPDSAGGVQEEYRKVTFHLADTLGNWLGTGFGTLYQQQCEVLRHVSPRQAQKLTVRHLMPDDTLAGVTDVVVRFSPERFGF